MSNVHIRALRGLLVRYNVRVFYGRHCQLGAQLELGQFVSVVALYYIIPRVIRRPF